MIPITQSLIKEMYAYEKGNTCGLQIKAKFIDGIEFEPTPSQLLGQWFEYKLTGQKTKHGKIPVPPTLKNGELPENYKKMTKHIEVGKEMFEHYGLTIVETGKRLKTNGNLQGDIDVVCKDINGKIVFVDIKSTALIDDNWSDFGWGENAIDQKDGLMLQPIHYKVLGKYEYGYYPDFYFFIFSTTDENHRKCYKVIHQDERIEQHAMAISKTVERVQFVEEYGWKAVPSPKRCGSCPLIGNCEHKTSIPSIVEIYY